MTQAQVAELVKALMGGNQGGKTKKKASKARGKGKGRAVLTEAEKTAYRAQNDAACLAAFAEKGIQDVQPRVNVLTYNKWVEKGFKVRPGEKSTKVGPFALFHASQVDAIPAQVAA